jgi:hypothetical protein
MWQLRQSDRPTAGFALAITEDEDAVAWCAREEDAAFIVEAREIGPEIVKAIVQFVTREAACSGVWAERCRRSESID